MKCLSTKATSIKPSGIRKFFDLASTMEGVISLGVGEPDFATPWHICENAIHYMSIGHTHYTANRGLLELREEICKFHKEHYNQVYDPENEVIVTIGGSEAIDLCMRALLNPGDEVIVLDPNYVAYAPSVILSDGVVVPLKLKEENDFKILPEDLKKVITPKTKAMIINYPSNPTGGVMTKEDYAKIIDIIKESGIYVISDEIYAELSFDQPFASLAQFDEIKSQIIVVNGFSKAYAMTGWRLGYCMANKELSSVMNKIHQYVIMSAPVMSQYAGIEAIKNGTFYVFCNIQSTGLDSETFCERLLQEQKVACVPGNAFGDSGEGYVRISYAYSIDHIKEAVVRLEQFLKDLDK